MKFLRYMAPAIALTAPVVASPALAANYLPGVGPVAVQGGGVVTLALPGRAGTPYRVQWLTGPYRLVVDLQGLWLGNPTSSIYIGAGLVQQIRAARHAGGVTRVVFDLTAPADMRADNRGGALVFTVIPRGAATGAVPVPMAPAYPGVPQVAPTRRPVPGYPGYPAYPPYGAYVPDGRVTPLPVMPPMGWATPAPGQPMARPTQPPIAYQTPPPMQAPMQTPPPDGTVQPPTTFSPEPLPLDIPVVDMPLGNKPVFSSRVYLGGGAAVSLAESFTAATATSGAQDASASFVPFSDFGYDQNFGDGQNFGISISGRTLGYTVSDQAATDLGLVSNHKRDEMQFTLGVRGRYEFFPGFEAMLQPQGVFRNVNVTNEEGVAGGTLTTPAVNTFLTSGHTDFGGGAAFGLGYRVLEWLSLAGGGEFNFLAGSMGQTGVPSILPLTNIGAGGEVRLDFGGFATTLGYKFTTYSNGGAGYSQTWHGPFLNVGYAY